MIGNRISNRFYNYSYLIPTTYNRYEAKHIKENKRVMSYSRWTQIIHFYKPGLKLARSKEDVCDACVRIDILLLDPDLSEADKLELEQQKRVHLDAAIGQRRAVSA